MLGTIVQVAAGLYYTLGGIYLLDKLDNYSDLVWPETNGRPKVSKSEDWGLLAFQAGLHEPQLVPDSGIFSASEGAWTVKVPWEIHLKRLVPPEELYDPKNSFWAEWAEQQATNRFERRQDYWESQGITYKKILADYQQKAAVPLAKEARFDLIGTWRDDYDDVVEMSISFLGQSDFSESSMSTMRSINKGDATVITLSVDGNVERRDLASSNQTHPVYFDRIYNGQFGINRNWNLGFAPLIWLKAVGISRKQLLRWFNYQNPDSVNLSILEEPEPRTQTLNLDW
jgi:hypothetical protein